MTSKVQLNRIKKLIVELKLLQKTTPKPVFNMGEWCELVCGPNLAEKIKEATKNPCGTYACLAGKAGLMPKFRRMGFKWDVTRDGSEGGIFRYKNYTGDTAIQRFFGRDVFISVFLSTWSINTLSQGIKALERFVDEAR